MFSFAGISAHVADGLRQESGEQLLLFLGEALDQPVLIGEDGAVHGFLAFPASGKDLDAFASAVCFVGAQSDKVFLFQTGKQAGDSGVAQVEGFFDVPGAGRGGAMGQIAHDAALSCGEVHVGKGRGHGLVSAAVQDSDQVAVTRGQGDHLLKSSLLPNILAQGKGRCKGKEGSLLIR